MDTSPCGLWWEIKLPAKSECRILALKICKPQPRACALASLTPKRAQPLAVDLSLGSRLSLGLLAAQTARAVLGSRSGLISV